MTNTNTPRVPLQLPPDWNEEALDALNAFPGGLKFVLNGWEENKEAVPSKDKENKFVINAYLAFVTNL